MGALSRRLQFRNSIFFSETGHILEFLSLRKFSSCFSIGYIWFTGDFDENQIDDYNQVPDEWAEDDSSLAELLLMTFEV